MLQGFKHIDKLGNKHYNTILYGEVPERPKGADCKSVVSDFDGSNPSLSTNCGYSSVVEYQLPKLAMRVRFPLPAPLKKHAHVAQQVEHFLGKEEVRRFEPARELHNIKDTHG